MNAVTTAEYQVLEHYDAAQLQHMINEHAAQGYKLLHYCAVPDEANRTLNFTAVIVREPEATNAETMWRKYDEALQAYTKLLEQTKTERTESMRSLEFVLTQQIEALEYRITELERKVKFLTQQAHSHSPGGSFGVTK